MNVSNPGQRFRPPPNGAPIAPGPRPVQDPRNGAIPPALTIQAPSSDRLPPEAQVSRAEKFEDEKRRIIESCFGKREPDGSISESYITHIRIEEDSVHPSSPPPPESAPRNKKPRVIVVAVRKSGRVRVHKVRENANGTFSIGKTWVLDDLTMIESFTHVTPATAQEQTNKQRAGAIGFIVTIQKPYYWTAATAKEKDFFIFSLIKIYKKYTGGHLPELYGFSQEELETLGAHSGSQNGQQSKAQPSAALGPGALGPGSRRPSQGPPLTVRALQLTDGAPPEISRERRQMPPQERPPPVRQLHSATSQERPLRGAPSKDRIRMPGSFPSSESVNSAPPPALQPGLRAKRSQSSSMRTTSSQEPDFRKPAVGQSTDSFRNGSDRLSSQATSSERSSSERVRQIETYAAGPHGADPPKQRHETANERSTNAMRSPEIPNLLAVQDRKSERPISFANQSFSPDKSTQDQIQFYDTRNGEIQDRSAIGEFSDRKQNGTPPIDQPESSGRFPNGKANDIQLIEQPELSRNRSVDDFRPMTAKSQGVVAANIPALGIASPTSTAQIEDVSSTIVPETTFSPMPPPETPIAPEPPTEAEVHRPGLGPMIKKKSNKEIASTFRKAAFKARAGLEKPREEKSASGDGITGVFQAPSLLKGLSQDDIRPVTPNQNQNPENRPVTPEFKKEPAIVQITTSPLKPSTPILQKPEIQRTVDVVESVDPVEAVRPPISENGHEEGAKNRRWDHSAKYAKALGINSSLLEGRTFDIESVLNDFGWGEENTEKTTFEDLQTGIRKEIGRVEAGSWLGAVENNDDRVVVVGEMMDRVMAECEELDCLLTLYNVELGTLSEDVAYIEAQSQGLQVQTANQRLLHTELKNLLDTISISALQLKVLKDASLTKARGIEEIEGILTQLYTAMLTIDPKLRQTGPRPTTGDQRSLYRSSSTGHGGTDLSSMHAVREKREGYRRESVDFIGRLKQYMSVKFRETEAETLDALEKNRTNKAINPTKLDYRLRDKPKRDLWLYSPLLLFAREIEPSEWEDLMHMYEGCTKKPYQEQFRDNVFAWKRLTRQSAGDEQDVLFTTQEKESEGIVGRKLTVKRSKTVQRADGTSRISSGDKPNDGKVAAYEAFAGALSEMARLIFVEQNFVINLFHASSPHTQDFLDAVATEPDQRRGGDLIVKQPFDPDRNMARKVLSVMEGMYSFWPADLQNLIDWAIRQYALNGVGVLFALESQLAEVEETNQEFLTQAVNKIHDRLATQFSRFIDEQIRGIEDTKVKIKKRKGVIAFMKTFPNFSIAVENMLPPTRSLDHLPIRTMVNEAYQRINKAMFESLKFIAKESPTATQAQTATAGDPEDKEALNYHILLIENMNHYIEEVAVRNNSVLEDWNFRARAEMSKHMELYLASVIRRPLGRLLDFLESTESLVKNTPSTAIATRASHSRSVFKKILSSYDGKELKRGIETLRKRVEKHFGEGDDTAGLSRGLVTKVSRECEKKYLDVTDRVGRLVRDVYEGSLEVEWRREDVGAAFRR